MQSYTDPLSIYNKPEYQMLDQRMQDQQMGKAAQSGTMFNAPERLAQRQTGFLDQLNQYRAPLMGMSGASTNPAQPAAFQSEMAKSMVPLEMEKAGAVGSGMQSGMNVIQSLPQIMQMIRQMGGGGQGS